MAEMFPRVFKPRMTREEAEQAAPENAVQAEALYRGEWGEGAVFHTLEKMPADWVIFHSVPIVLPPTKDKENACELDFVILVPGKGILCLEVKNWSEQTVASKAEGGELPPHVKANNSKEIFVDWLAGQGLVRSWVEYRSAVVMLHAYAEQMADDPLYLCGQDAWKPERLQDFILSQFQTDKGFSHKDLMKVRGLLTESQEYRISLEDYHARLNRATAHLENILPMLEESEGHISVTGGAGTGKTFMAKREAVRLAAAGQRVLFLCFNKNLAICLRQEPDVAEQIATGKLTLNNYHAFCSERLPNPFYQGELGTQGMNTLGEALAAEPYDAIFVDEAQDFQADWWLVLGCALKEGGRWYIFYDERQNLYGDGQTPVEENGMPETPIRLRLRTNLRSSEQIAKYGARLRRDPDPDTLHLKGPEVKRLPAVKDPAARAAKVQELVDSLLKGEQKQIFAPKRHQIVILSPWRREKDRSCARYLSGINASSDETHRVPELAAARYRNTILNPNAKEILYETIKSFKGLESDFIILTDVPAADSHPGFTTADYYVAVTRARYGLYIVPSE